MTETKLNNNDRLKISNYTIYRQDSGYRGGGVAILIRKNIPHLPLPNITSNIENIAIMLKDRTVIRAAYNRPRHKMTNQDLMTLLTEQTVLLIGDLNARHADWNNRRNNSNGNFISEKAETHNLAVIAPDRPTHYPTNGSRPTTIDIVINKNYSHALYPISLTRLSSDHNPVTITLTKTDINVLDKDIFNYKGTNWKEFRKIVNNELKINHKIETGPDIDNEVDNLTNIIRQARDKTTKLIKQKLKEENIPQEIINLIKFKNKLKKKWQKFRRINDRQRLAEIQETIRNRLDDHRNKSWNEKIKNLSVKDNSLWKMAKLLRKPFHNITTLVKNGQTATMDDHKAELIAENLCKTCTSRPDDTEEQIRITNETRNFINDIIRQKIPTRILSKILTTPNQIHEIIKKLPNNKAPGPDTLPNIVLKNLPQKAIVAIASIINKIITLQYFPKQWKNAIVIPILKPSKNPQDPSSYRPISLLDTMSKVAEKIISNNLNIYIKKNKLINKEQLGFRSGCSTTHAIAKVVQDAIIQFNRKQSTVALLLDIQKAFDTVWTDGLIYKMKNYHKLPDYITNLFYTYLTERYIQVRVNNKLSTIKPLKAGVPQGTILSPVLFNLYISDLPTCPITKTIMYADDTIIYASSFSAQTATEKIKYHISKLTDYYGKWKIDINTQKTETIILTRKFTNVQVFSKIKINDDTIRENNPIKYLGLLLDRRLTFTQQISSILKRVYIVLSKLYPLLNRRSRLSTTNKLTIYKTILRPIMTYGGQIFHNISKTQYLRLQTTQNKLLRLLTNSDRYVNMAQLHEEYGIDYVRNIIKAQAKKFYQQNVRTCELTRAISHVPDDIRHVHKYLHENIDL